MPGSAALKVTTHTPGWGRPVFGWAVAAAQAAPPSRRGAGVAEEPPTRTATPSWSRRRGARGGSLLTFTVPLAGERTPAAPPTSRGPVALHPAPSCQDPRRALRAPPGLPRRWPPPPRAATGRHSPRPQREPFFRGKNQGRLGGRGGGGTGDGGVGVSGRARKPARWTWGATRRCGCTSGNEAAAAEPRASASTSRGSLLTLHREEAAAEEEEEEAAPGRPPPRARRSPSGRSRPRRTRLLGSAKPRSGRAALGTAPLPAPRSRPLQQRAGCSPGRGPGLCVCGGEHTGKRTAEHEGLRLAPGRGGPCAPGGPAGDPSE